MQTLAEQPASAGVAVIMRTAARESRATSWQSLYTVISAISERLIGAGSVTLSTTAWIAKTIRFNPSAYAPDAYRAHTRTD